MGRVPVEVERSVRRVGEAYRLDRAILFGSRARGDHLKHSDYDIILVSDDFARVPFPERAPAVHRFWASDDALEPLCYTRDEFRAKAGQIGIVRVPVREGIEVDVAPAAAPAPAPAAGWQRRTPPPW